MVSLSFAPSRLLPLALPVLPLSPHYLSLSLDRTGRYTHDLLSFLNLCLTSPDERLERFWCVGRRPEASVSSLVLYLCPTSFHIAHEPPTTARASSPPISLCLPLAENYVTDLP
jgi:hypothetical protein